MIELQGRVQHYLVTIIGESNTLTKTVAADKDSIIVASLQPNNRYEVTLVMVMHGGATIASIPVYVITKDGGKRLEFLMYCNSKITFNVTTSHYLPSPFLPTFS